MSDIPTGGVRIGAKLDDAVRTAGGIFRSLRSTANSSKTNDYQRTISTGVLTWPYCTQSVGTIPANSPNNSAYAYLPPTAATSALSGEN